VVLLLALAVVAGCGGSHGEDEGERALTVPAYGPFPAMTVPVTRGTPEYCRAKAEAFTRAAAGFLRPSDADNYRVLARVQLAAFQAHGRATRVLREALMRRLTAKLHVVLSFFGFLGGDRARARTSASVLTSSFVGSGRADPCRPGCAEP
jgi:hypothetical protein